MKMRDHRSIVMNRVDIPGSRYRKNESKTGRANDAGGSHGVFRLRVRSLPSFLLLLPLLTPPSQIEPTD